MVKTINNNEQYERALSELNGLMSLRLSDKSSELESLKLLTLVIKDYESGKFKIENPSPIEAIKFRMEQSNLSSRDLIPFLGSRSKVSEILSGKRQLTLSMISALHKGLGLSANVLIQKNVENRVSEEFDWKKYPLKIMNDRKWINLPPDASDDDKQEIVLEYLSTFDTIKVTPAYLKKTLNIRSSRNFDNYSLSSWTARVIKVIQSPKVDYKPNTVDLAFIKNVIRLSPHADGPNKAIKFLEEIGIPLVIVPLLPKTYLDGAVIGTNEKRPLIGMTLRHDRIDNFWFCLAHELAHISLHYDKIEGNFYDDLDYITSENKYELEADKLAQEALIPKIEWEKSPARKLRSPEAVNHLANKIGIHPAIVAGRIRFAYNDYRRLSQLVGHNEVRKCFPEINWSD